MITDKIAGANLLKPVRLFLKKEISVDVRRTSVASTQAKAPEVSHWVCDDR